MVVSGSWQQLFIVPIYKLVTETVGSSATLHVQYSLAFEGLVSIQ